MMGDRDALEKKNGDFSLHRINFGISMGRYLLIVVGIFLFIE